MFTFRGIERARLLKLKQQNAVDETDYSNEHNEEKMVSSTPFLAPKRIRLSDTSDFGLSPVNLFEKTSMSIRRNASSMPKALSCTVVDPTIIDIGEETQVNKENENMQSNLSPKPPDNKNSPKTVENDDKDGSLRRSQRTRAHQGQKQSAVMSTNESQESSLSQENKQRGSSSQYPVLKSGKWRRTMLNIRGKKSSGMQFS